MRGSQHLYIWVGGWPPGSRAARGGRPPGSRATGPRDLSTIIFHFFFAEKPLPPGCRAARSRPPGSWAAGVYFCKFPYRKYIFIKNKNKNIEIKKPRRVRAWVACLAVARVCLRMLRVAWPPPPAAWASVAVRCRAPCAPPLAQHRLRCC